MKKILVCIVFFILSMSSVNAAWYGDHIETYYWNTGKKNCSPDGDETGGRTSLNGSMTDVRALDVTISNGYFNQIMPGGNIRADNGLTIVGGNASGLRVRCQYWDASLPESLSLNLSQTGWTKDPVKVTVTARDRGGSKLKLMRLQQSVNSGGWQTIANWDNLNAQNTNITRSRTQVAVNGRSYKYRFVAYDYAGNEAYSAESAEVKFDTSVPEDPEVSAEQTGDDGTEVTLDDDTWTNDNLPTITVISDAETGSESPRHNEYCMVKRSNPAVEVPCEPSDPRPGVFTPVFGSDGIYDYYVETCTEAGNCSNRVHFVIKIDTTEPGKPEISATETGDDGTEGDLPSDTWTNDNSPTINSSPNTDGEQSPRHNEYCMVQEPTTDCNPDSTTIPDTSSLEDGIYHYYVRTCTEAGTCGEKEHFVIKIDTTAPTIADVTNNNPSDLLANSGYDYGITIGDNGVAPITSIKYQKENRDNNALSGDISDNAAPWSFPWDISKVDNYRVTNGSRQYTYSLRQICDEAGNCWNGNQNYNHNVYANTMNITSSIDSNDLASTIIADGTAKNVLVHLKDQYGNAIIPASGIGRTIDMNIGVNNDLRLNQYNNGLNDSALYIDTNTNAINIGIGVLKTLDDRGSTDGKYTIPFYVYAPTYIYDSINDEDVTQVPGKASINGISFSVVHDFSHVAWDNNGTIGNATTAIKAQPLYQTDITGELANNGFREGAAQTVSIGVTNANNAVGTTNKSLMVEFGDSTGAGASNNNENDRYKLMLNVTNVTPTEVPEGYVVSGPRQPPSLGLSHFNGTSLMIQDGAMDVNPSSYFATIVKYNIGTGVNQKTIIYPSDIIGKDSYHGTKGGNNSYQTGVKVTGNTSSQNTEAITTDQFSNDIRILGKLTKSTFRRDIEKKVYGVIRGISNASVTEISASSLSGDTWSTNNNATVLFGGTVRYIKDPSAAVQISGSVSGNKTLVVENGDVYINGNITGDGMLGIIVLNGDILIKTSVTDIHAILYTSKSILSSMDGSPITTDDATASNLANQLYIKGSLFSENTIGGSRKASPECPYYVNTTCEQAEAQLYDLNYLRRYYRYDSDGDGDVDTSDGSASDADGQTGFEDFPVIIDYNPAIQQTPPPLFD